MINAQVSNGVTQHLAHVINSFCRINRARTKSTGRQLPEESLSLNGCRFIPFNNGCPQPFIYQNCDQRITHRLRRANWFEAYWQAGIVAPLPIAHMETETYTWPMLPHALRPTGDDWIAEGLARELAWTRDNLVALGLEAL